MRRVRIATNRKVISGSPRTAWQRILETYVIGITTELHPGLKARAGRWLSAALCLPLNDDGERMSREGPVIAT